MFDNNKLGEIRPNQLITTFGPGAIVDAVKDSVTILDLNYWKEKGKKIVLFFLLLLGPFVYIFNWFYVDYSPKPL